MRGNPEIHFVYLFMGSVGKVLIPENGYLQQVVHNIISSVWPISTHAHSQITRRIATMDRCFVPVRTHQHGLYCRLQKRNNTTPLKQHSKLFRGSKVRKS